MKLLSAISLIVIFLIGFIVGMFFSKTKIALEKEHLNYLIELHNFQRTRSREACVASDTILNRIGRLIDDETILSKGKASKDPIKNLLLQSYHCISGNAQVLHNYDRQVYPEDSAFLKKYIKLEE